MGLRERVSRLEGARGADDGEVCACIPRRYELRDSSGDDGAEDTRPARRCERCGRPVVIIRLVRAGGEYELGE